MNVINTVCPFCGTEHQLPKSSHGQRANCPECKAAYVVDPRSEKARAKPGPKSRWARTTILWVLAGILFVACLVENIRLDRQDYQAIKDANNAHTAALRLRDLVGGPYPSYREAPKASRTLVYFLAGAGLAFVALGITCMPVPRPEQLPS